MKAIKTGSYLTKSPIEKDVDLIVNFYGKQGEKEALKAAINGIIRKVREEKPKKSK